MKLSIVVLTPGPTQGKAIPITLPQFIIGREAGCQLRPASILISKRHCALLRRDDKVFLRDFGSTNGTFVNDRQIKGEIELMDGDQLRVGPLLFAVRLETATSVDRPTPLPGIKQTTQKAAPTAPAQSPTSEPETKQGPVEEEDAAALLLSLHDNDGPATSGLLNDVPEGTTILELPKPAEIQEAAEKAKKPSGDTSTAAKSILEKYLKRPRTT